MPKKAGGAKPPKSRDSGKSAASIAGKVLAGKKPTTKELATLAGSVLSQNEKP
jgi:ABC-type uncharacterized transport system substrate-binding protein